MPDGSFGSIGSLMPTPSSRDDEIIAYCAAILRLRQAGEELGHNAAPGSPAERALDNNWSQIGQQERRMVKHMCRLRARTPEAQQARALLLRGWFPNDLGVLTWADDKHAMQIVSALVRDQVSSAFEA